MGFYTKNRSLISKLFLLISIIAILVWLNQSVLELKPARIQEWILSFGTVAPLLYMVIYTVRPLILFPASLLSLAGGLAFGPIWGMLYTVIGATLGAVLSFVVARKVGASFGVKANDGRWKKIAGQLEEKGFITILVFRLIPLFSFDLISYAAGVSKVRLRAFLFGTLIGILPGTFTYNFLGASFAEENTGMIVIAVVLFLLAILIPMIVKKVMARKEEGRV